MLCLLSGTVCSHHVFIHPTSTHRPSVQEVRQHAFFTQHQVPSSLPSSCTTSAPIWSTDEFGELHAIKPTSALDVPTAKSNKTSTTKTAKALTNKKTGGFNIFSDDVNDKPAVSSKKTAESKPAVVTTTPVNKLTSQMASCGLGDDEVRDMPPPSSTTEATVPPTSSSATPDDKLLLSPQETANGTPAQQSSPSDPSNSDGNHELVMMHSRLEECLINYERIQNGGPKVECPLKGGEVWGANKWVTRYVDYTSKYGLGFLLNDGSSGVYFNDSTKAVHAAEGDNFVYVERRKASADGSGGVKEPVSTYTVNDYPEDTLKKKVTLLQHFRSYLLEQQKRAEDAGEVQPLSAVSPSEGAGDEDQVDTSTTPIVFMKKWIKTKHAMLFRLSNGTIQVLFHDQTEVLISSEGNLITFVDKEKNRFVHSIAEIANKQHSDVSRRLKYAKEILSQLISASKR